MTWWRACSGCTRASWWSASRPAGPAARPVWTGPDAAEGLSDRESEILALITQGKSNAEVAKITFLSPNTIKSYVRTIYRKIGVSSRTQAVLWGVRHGFVPGDSRMQTWR